MLIWDFLNPTMLRLNVGTIFSPRNFPLPSVPQMRTRTDKLLQLSHPWIFYISSPATSTWYVFWENKRNLFWFNFYTQLERKYFDGILTHFTFFVKFLYCEIVFIFYTYLYESLRSPCQFLGNLCAIIIQVKIKRYGPEIWFEPLLHMK